MPSTDYIDPETEHHPTTGTTPSAEWAQIIRDDLEHLVDPPRASVYCDALTLTDDTFTVLDWTDDDYDTDGWWDGTDEHLVCPTGLGGLYRISGAAAWTADAAEPCDVAILLEINGTVVESFAEVIAGPGPNGTRIGRSRHWRLIPGDTIGLVAYRKGSASVIQLDGARLDLIKVAR